MISPKKIVVIAPHPDDETLGAGGAITRFVSEGAAVSILFVSGHLPPLYEQSAFDKTKAEARKACKIMGVQDFSFLEIPATTVRDTPVAELNNQIKNYIGSRKPDFVLIPFPDRHIDHRVIFDACMVATRPVGPYFPRLVAAYETLSETHWNAVGIEAAFQPDFFIDVEQFFDIKKLALSAYQSQIINNESRSIDACEALAKFRGSQNGCHLAEAFKIIRLVV